MDNQTEFSEIFSDPSIKEKVLLSIIEGSLYFCSEHGEPQVQEFLTNQFLAAMAVSGICTENWEASRLVDVDAQALAYDIEELVRKHDYRTNKQKRIF